MKKQMITKVLLITGVIVAILALKANAQSGQGFHILGKWYAEEMDESVIEVKQDTDGSVKGVIIESSNEEYVGKKVIYDCRFDAEDDAYKGKIYSVARKMEIDGTFTLEAADKLKIVGKKLFITKTFYWVRK